MEFSLAKNVKRTFVNDGDDDEFSSYKFVSINPEPVVAEEHIRTIYLEKLSSVLDVQSPNTTKKIRTDVVKLQMYIQSEEEIDEALSSSDDSSSSSHEKENELHKMHVKCFTIGEGSFLERVFNAFKVVREESGAADSCDAVIQLKLQRPYFHNEWLIKSASEIKVTTAKNGRELQYSLTYNDAVSKKIARIWNTSRRKFGAMLTFVLILNDAAVDRLFLRNHSTAVVPTVLRDMLDNEREADIDIMPGGDGTNPVKCHRAILASRSPVFQAMFQSGMQEATSNKIKVPEMSEPVIRAFIKYLYTLDVEAPMTDCGFALELLKAANYYDVADLRKAMYELIIMKSVECEWFTVDFIIDLLLYTRNLVNATNTDVVPAPQNKKLKLDVPEETMWKDLNQKAVKLIIWYSKEKPTELKTSEQFKRLHRETPELAIELHVSFIKCANSNTWQN